ncbi:MAG: bifunctional DNA-formamidopyrimidine glycosylase/DNA-(apurinic or apyrimidinic site) lyase [Terriglobales bacterium]
MPELPEVETVARGLRRALLGARIAAVEERFPGLVRGARERLEELPGCSVAVVTRAGKFLRLDLRGAELPRGRRDGPGGAEGTIALWLHLGMSGKLLVTAGAEPVARHTHFVLRFTDGREMRYVDPRRFGRVEIGGENAAATGAEPLEIGAEDFAGLFWRRTGAIKGLLLRQDLLRGLGNIYADESLFRAGIRPRARRVSRPRLKRLHGAVRAVLAEAIRAGGSSIADYVGADGERGWFQVRHRVYGREGKACVACGTAIRRVVVAGRSSCYCPKCQK